MAIGRWKTADDFQICGRFKFLQTLTNALCHRHSVNFDGFAWVEKPFGEFSIRE